MHYLDSIFRIIGSLGLFLYGMKVMSDGIQHTAGPRLQQVLGFMTGNRVTAVLTGLVVTAIIQSSSATTVMVVSFVNAGLLTLTQAIGVIMGANIGTTITGWIVSLVGFTLSISSLALPAVGLGFVMRMLKWKHRMLGEVLLGFGILFLGLDFLTQSMPRISPEALSFIGAVSNRGVVSTLIGTGIGVVMTVITHSSSASTAIMLTMAHNGLIDYPMAATMILGANIGTTIDAALASIGTKTAARQTALVHVLFNVIGTVWALILFRPLLFLVDWITPGSISETGITTRLAMFHSVFNLINTLLFFPFVKPFAVLVSFLIKDTPSAPVSSISSPYILEYKSGSIQDTPELNILRAEKEIRDMAGVAAAMYQQVSTAFPSLQQKTAEDDKNAAVEALVRDMGNQEQYTDEMREELTRFLIECTRQHLSPQTERKVSMLLRIVTDLEEVTDECFSVALLLERSVKKNLSFKNKEMEALMPYMGMAEASLNFVQDHLGHPLSPEQAVYAKDLEGKIDRSRNKLRKLGRKRIEAGQDVKTELLFIDVVRRIENLGDYCYDIAVALGALR
ncbi:MAG: Na/Pi cotransporter family protein [Treponema sp.]|jgi:phosphate:Na+ symporter|nr:Na/Pi cotransporter family protein [Treponema sp.]